MKFELNDYHRNIPTDELLFDVKDTAKRLNKSTLTMDEYAKHGKYNSSTISRRFGSWKVVLKLCGLEIKGHNFKYQYADEDVINDLWRVANILGRDTVTRDEYDAYGEYVGSTLEKRYGTWNFILQLANMRKNVNRSITDKDLLQEIERIWILLGRQPTSTDIKNGVSKYSLQSYARRFGGWRGALQAFVDWVGVDDGTETEREKCEDKPTVSDVKAEPEKTDIRTRTTSRDINLRLRFRVMQRDNFKCCMCGASPAKDPAVELHIDHIVPWAKGGETTFDNLQTLCSKCNLGKSDLLFYENT